MASSDELSSSVPDSAPSTATTTEAANRPPPLIPGAPPPGDASATPLAPSRPHQPDAPAATALPLPPLWTLLVAALAFLLASSAATNSDLWMHLARGRLLAHGDFSLATDPQFVPGLPPSHAWLYDLVCYGIYATLGELGLMIAKALLVAVLAVVLLRFSRSSGAWWVAALGTALALLAMGIRLPLRPVTVSYLFMTLALVLVGYRDVASPNRGSPLRSLVPLFVLFVVWANVDGGFLLGLGAVALVWLGEILDAASGTPQQHGGWPALLARRGLCLALLAAVCLLNPALLDAFTLPAELTLGQADASASSDVKLITSPFQAAYILKAGLTPAGLAYFPLLGLSLLSFALTLPHWSWRRFLPWLGLALLSAVQVRAVPFFAVVAGPVLAWNIQDYLRRRSEAARRRAPAWHQESALGPALTGILLVVLVVCAWPGWLQSPPFEPRRWTIETPPSLPRGAEKVRDWLQRGQLPRQARGLHLSAESAYAFAWFCPEASGVYDDRLAAALHGNQEAAIGFDKRMRAAGINYVIVHDPDRYRFFAGMQNLLANPQRWPLLHMQGYLAIFGWRDPAADGTSDPFEKLELDLNRLAFHPAESKRDHEALSDQEPQPRLWWEAFWKPVPPRPLDQEEATLYLLHADALLPSASRRHQEAWQICQQTGLVGAAAGWNGMAGLFDACQRATFLEPAPLDPSRYTAMPVLDQLAHAALVRFVQQRDDTSPALLYLALRATRRALAVNPNDAQAYLVLGETYLRLLHHTRERAWAEHLPELTQLRQSQAAAALYQAVLLKPDLTQAHFSLSKLYGEMRCLDLTVEHLRTYLKLIEETGDSGGVGAEQIAAYQKELDQLAKELERREHKFVVTTTGWKVGDRALKAWQDGLAAKARDLLLESDVSAFGPPGMKLELELLLRTGRAKEVRDWSAGPDQKTLMGQPLAYHMLRVCAQAALGDYAAAREECNELSQGMEEVWMPSLERPLPVRAAMAMLESKRYLRSHSPQTSILSPLTQMADRMLLQRNMTDLAQALKRHADATVLRALLTLEEGDTIEAEVAFREALSLSNDADSGGGLDFNGRIIAQDVLRWMQE